MRQVTKGKQHKHFQSVRPSDKFIQKPSWIYSINKPMGLPREIDADAPTLSLN